MSFFDYCGYLESVCQSGKRALSLSLSSLLSLSLSYSSSLSPLTLSWSSSSELLHGSLWESLRVWQLGLINFNLWYCIVSHGIALVLHGIARCCIVLHCIIVGFGARAVSCKTPIYFILESTTCMFGLLSNHHPRHLHLFKSHVWTAVEPARRAGQDEGDSRWI